MQITSRQPIDARIIDVEFPDMFGFDFHETLRLRYSQARFALGGNTYRSEDELRARASWSARNAYKPPRPWWLVTAMP